MWYSVTLTILKSTDHPATMLQLPVCLCITSFQANLKIHFILKYTIIYILHNIESLIIILGYRVVDVDQGRFTASNLLELVNWCRIPPSQLWNNTCLTPGFFFFFTVCCIPSSSIVNCEATGFYFFKVTFSTFKNIYAYLCGHYDWPLLLMSSHGALCARSCIKQYRMRLRKRLKKKWFIWPSLAFVVDSYSS